MYVYQLFGQKWSCFTQLWYSYIFFEFVGIDKTTFLFLVMYNTYALTYVLVSFIFTQSWYIYIILDCMYDIMVCSYLQEVKC